MKPILITPEDEAKLHAEEKRLTAMYEMKVKQREALANDDPTRDALGHEIGEIVMQLASLGSKL